jgi:hypothetical protein
MTKKRHGRGGAPAMWGRAEDQAGSGAAHLFARLGAQGERRDASIAALERLAARLRAGEWSDALADLAAHAVALEQALRGEESAR